MASPGHYLVPGATCGWRSAKSGSTARHTEALSPPAEVRLHAIAGLSPVAEDREETVVGTEAFEVRSEAFDAPMFRIEPKAGKSDSMVGPDGVPSPHSLAWGSDSGGVDGPVGTVRFVASSLSVLFIKEKPPERRYVDQAAGNPPPAVAPCPRGKVPVQRRTRPGHDRLSPSPTYTG